MASLADLFVNDAFGTAHRAHSSTEGVTKFLKGAVDQPTKPMAAIVGGAKVSTKIPVIESMLDKVDKLIIGGGMVFTFLKARGLSVGNSLVEDDLLELVKKLEEQAKAKGVEIILPSDVACGDEFPAGGKEVGFKVVPAEEIPDGWLGLDNGPKATEEIKAALADCKTIIWNGPMGVFESTQFSKGTYDVAECIAELTEKNGAISIIGGGDSVSAVNKSGLAPKMSHISTGGGASLELLEGKELPGVAALDEKELAAAAFCGQRKAANFDWEKRAGAASSVGEAFIFEKPLRSYADYEFGNSVGYLPDGTLMNRAGNDINHPETIAPDPHVPGSALPRAIFVNDIGYLPDGTSMSDAGNLSNHR